MTAEKRFSETIFTVAVRTRGRRMADDWNELIAKLVRSGWFDDGDYWDDHGREKYWKDFSFSQQCEIVKMDIEEKTDDYEVHEMDLVAVTDDGKSALYCEDDDLYELRGNSMPRGINGIAEMRGNVTRDFCFRAVQRRSRILGKVPESMLDGEICEAAVKDKWFALADTPKALRSRDLCMMAVKQNGRALEFVPEALRDSEICRAAVEKTSYALDYVPESVIDRGMCLTAIENAWGSGILETMKRVPERLRDRDICMAAVTSNGLALKYVPENLRDKEMCIAALNKSDDDANLVLDCVPGGVRDHDVYAAAVRNGGWLVAEVPEKFLDKEICIGAVEWEGGCLECVPERMRDMDVCMAAVRNSDRAFEFVPEALRNGAASAGEFLAGAGMEAPEESSAMPAFAEEAAPETAPGAAQ